jgi:hypothetical protein
MDKRFFAVSKYLLYLIMRKEYPYQNTSIKNIKGEKWKDIPGFEDEYELSSHGRLKSQDRWIDYGKYDVFRQGRVKKPSLTRSVKNSAPELRMQLHKDGKRYWFSVARYVYHLFVAAFDTEDHSIIITRKDGDGLNCYCKNLVLRSVSDVAKEGYATNRRKSQFQLQVKAVTQYDPNGKKIAAFKNAKQAAAATGLSPNYISDAARVRRRMAGGYYWRYGEPKPQIDVLRLKKTIDLPLEGEMNLPRYYLNRGINNIQGEKWKAIEGFEGLYEVSDHGRVKSLRRLRQLITSKRNITQHWTREFIMKQIVRKTRNEYIDNTLYYLTISLKREDFSTIFLVSRLVYQAFGIDKQALGSMIIAHKDEDNLNNHISNLHPATRTEIYKESFAKGRKKNPFANFTQEQRRKYSLLTVEANKKRVSQYSLKGKHIALFDSVKAASKATSIGDTSISNAMNGRYHTAGGFIWKKISKKN